MNKMNKFVVQSRPDAQGMRVFFGMDTDPRRAPYSGDLKDEFLMKVGTTREGDVVMTCYDVNADRLAAAGATIIARGKANLSGLPGDHAPGAWPLAGWRAEVLGIA